ncbi:MAG TPA: pseudouridine synthase [Rhodocyclaceae bacterium]|jgi:23S rRNA pseudouridine2457 synthase
MARLILLNKPYGVLTQFTDGEGRPTLKDYVPIPGVYPCGRLDSDSEGLVVLTDDGALQARIADPRHKLAKVYWAQVEKIPDADALRQLSGGLDLGDFITRPCQTKLMNEPENLWHREPPIRYRAAIPTGWVELTLKEGKNRQVRRMTAKVGYPTLRLIRWSVGDWTLEGLQPGEWRELTVESPAPKNTKPAGQPSSRRNVSGHDTRRIRTGAKFKT